MDEKQFNELTKLLRGIDTKLENIKRGVDRINNA